MGNTQQTEYGGILIQTDKPYYFSGEQVSGNIYLNVQNLGYPGAVLILELNGKEKCSWWEHRYSQVQESKEKKRYVWYTTRESSKENIYSNKVVIHQFQENSLQLGQYVFPFKFNLDSSVPGSYFGKTFNYTAKINYSIKATIETNNENYKSIYSKQQLIIRQPCQATNTSLGGVSETKIQNYGFKESGQTYMHCVFNKSQFQSGETAIVWIDIDNSQCKLDVKSIRLKLINYLQLKNKKKQVLFIDTIVTQEIEGIKAGQTALNENRKIVQLPLVIHKNNKLEQINPTVLGKWISSTYELQAEAKYNGIFATVAKVQVPIHILVPQPMEQKKFEEPPKQWEPIVYDNVDLQIDRVDESLLVYENKKKN